MKTMSKTLSHLDWLEAEAIHIMREVAGQCSNPALLFSGGKDSICLLRLADDALIPVAPAMRSLNQVQVIGDALLIHTDRDAPRGRACVASLTAPTEWRTLIPENDDSLQTVTGVGGRLYAVYSHAASHRVRVHAADGAYLRELELPALGSVNHNSGEGIVSGIGGAWGGDEVWVSFESYVQPPSIYRYDYAADRLTPYHVPDVGLDASVIRAGDRDRRRVGRAPRRIDEDVVDAQQQRRPPSPHVGGAAEGASIHRVDQLGVHQPVAHDAIAHVHVAGDDDRTMLPGDRIEDHLGEPSLVREGGVTQRVRRMHDVEHERHARCVDADAHQAGERRAHVVDQP